MIKKTISIGNPAYLSMRQYGEVVIFSLTDKQFGNIETFNGKKPLKPHEEGFQLELFRRILK